ncbi:MAG: HAD-IA family hydrolase [Candidatus Nanoarchaeia archaeon]|jgi:2-haloacid dehalogenase|nr:HAD-IA family hydrolase [Candidatus Nanoarchaeia archaeon]
MKIDTIIFDLGGVLVSDATIYSKKKLCDFSEVLKLSGVKYNDAKKLWISHWHNMKYGNEDLSNFWKDFKPLIKTDFSLSKVIKKYESKIIKDKDMFLFANKLKKSFTLFALANESRTGIDLKIKKFKLNSLFKKVYCSAYLNMAKPNKDIFKYVIKDSKIDINKTIFIDNQIENIIAAESVGIKSILYKNIKQLKKDLYKFKLIDKKDLL